MQNLEVCYLMSPPKTKWFKRIYAHFVKTYIICVSRYVYDEDEKIEKVFKKHKVKIYRNDIYTADVQFQEHDYDRVIGMTVLQVVNTESNIELFKEAVEEIRYECYTKNPEYQVECAEFEEFIVGLKDD